jgi:hypothetical protein
VQRCTPPLGTCYNLRAKHHLTKRPRRNVESEIYVRSQKTRIFLKTTIYTLVQVLTVVHVYLHLAHVVLCAMRHVSAAARSHRQSILTQHGIVQHPAARLRTLFPRLLKISSLTFRPKTPSFQKFQFLKFTYFPLFLNWHPPYFRGACCASTLSTGKCWCRQFPPSHSCRFLKSSPSWYVFRFSFP